MENPTWNPPFDVSRAFISRHTGANTDAGSGFPSLARQDLGSAGRMAPPFIKRAAFAHLMPWLMEMSGAVYANVLLLPLLTCLTPCLYHICYSVYFCPAILQIFWSRDHLLVVRVSRNTVGSLSAARQQAFLFSCFKQTHQKSDRKHKAAAGHRFYPWKHRLPLGAGWTRLKGRPDLAKRIGAAACTTSTATDGRPVSHTGDSQTAPCRLWDRGVLQVF